MTTVPIIDAHLDLAWNALSFNRDLRLPVDEVRRRESGMSDVPGRGRGTVTFPELCRAGVRVCVATLLARAGPEQTARQTEHRISLDFVDPLHACAVVHGQLAYYRLLEQGGAVRVLRSASDLNAHWEGARERAESPLGIILGMEGADPILSPKQVVTWWDAGVRVVGPAHYGRGQYAYGTGVDGPLGPAGRALLVEFARVGMILDATHLSDRSMEEALDLFRGPVLASHHNSRALVPGDRQLTDAQIKQLVGRGAVIGTAMDAWMLHPGWERGRTQRQVVGLSAAADQIERVCQLAGTVQHAAIGSDLDGGFGTEQTPRDLDTIADLQKLAPILSARHFSDAQIDDILHGNWLRFFRLALPEATSTAGRE